MIYCNVWTESVFNWRLLFRIYCGLIWFAYHSERFKWNFKTAEAMLMNHLCIDKMTLYSAKLVTRVFWVESWSEAWTVNSISDRTTVLTDHSILILIVNNLNLQFLAFFKFFYCIFHLCLEFQVILWTEKITGFYFFINNNSTFACIQSDNTNIKPLMSFLLNVVNYNFITYFIIIIDVVVLIVMSSSSASDNYILYIFRPITFRLNLLL